jgi:hypothetical protein
MMKTRMLMTAEATIGMHDIYPTRCCGVLFCRITLGVLFCRITLGDDTITVSLQPYVPISFLKHPLIIPRLTFRKGGSIK